MGFGVVGWSAQSTFANGAGGSTLVGTIPSGSYGVSPQLVVAIGYKGGRSTTPSGSHDLLLNFGAGDVVFTVAAGYGLWGSLSGGDDGGIVFGVTARQASGGANLTLYDGGVAVKIRTNDASANPPEIGVCAAMLITFTGPLPGGGENEAHDNMNFTVQNGSGSVSTSGLLAIPGYTATSRSGFAGLGQFETTSPTPTLPSCASIANWADVQQIRSSDGRGIGQAVAMVGLYTPPSVALVNPVPWALTNVTTGDGIARFVVIPDVEPAPAFKPPSWVAVIS